MSDDIELGQAIYGNPTGEHPCPRWVDALVAEIIDDIDRVFWNKNQREWNQCEDPRIPGVEFRPYFWGDDDAEAAKPNLKHGAIEVRWYKHPGRGTSLNVAATPEVIIPWFDSAIAAIDAADAP